MFFRDEDYAYNEPSCGYKQSFGYQKQAQDFVWHLGRVMGMGEESMRVGKRGKGEWGWVGLRGRATLAGKSEISGYKDLVNDACVSIHRDWS